MTDDELIEAALAAARRAGVSETEIAGLLRESAAEPPDDFVGPVLAGRLYALARLAEFAG